jgi:hypothetical protein
MNRSGRLVLCSLVMQGCSAVSAMDGATGNGELLLEKAAFEPTAGEYRIGEFSGHWQRHATGNGLAGHLDAFDGQVQFTLQDPVLESALDITCNLQEAALRLTGDSGSVISYGCDFLVDGRRIPARFELQQLSAGGVLLGEIALDRVIVGLLQLKTQGGVPAFLFTMEGRRLGLVSFEGQTRVHFYEEAPLAARRAVVATVMAMDLLGQQP